MDKPIELELSFHQFLAVITGTEHATGLCAKILTYKCHGMIPTILFFVACSEEF
jgi:hypothetical protein